MKKYVIQFHTYEPKPPEIFLETQIPALLERVQELAKNRAKYVILEAYCICDFS